MSITLNTTTTFNAAEAAQQAFLDEKLLREAELAQQANFEQQVRDEAEAEQAIVEGPDGSSPNLEFPDSVLEAEQVVINPKRKASPTAAATTSKSSSRPKQTGGGIIPPASTPDTIRETQDFMDRELVFSGAVHREQAASPTEYAIAKEADAKTDNHDSFGSFLSEIESKINGIVKRVDKGETLTSADSDFIYAGRPGLSRFSTKKSSKYTAADEELKTRFDRVLNTFNAFEPNSTKINSKFTDALGTAVLAIGASSRDTVNFNKETDRALENKGLNKQQVMKYKQDLKDAQTPFQPGRSAQDVTQILQETVGFNEEGKATTKDMEFFVNTLLKSLTTANGKKGSLLKQVANTEGQSIDNTNQPTYFELTPRFDRVVESAQATRALLRERKVREPSNAPSVPSRDNADTSGTTPVTGQQAKGRPSIPGIVGTVIDATPSQTAEDKKFIERVEQAVSIYDAAFSYLDTLPFYIEPSITSAATQKAAMVMADLQKFGDAVAKPSSAVRPTQVVMTNGSNQIVSVSVYTEANQIPSGLLSLSPQSVGFKASAHPFAKLFDLDAKSLLSRLNDTRPKNKVVWAPGSELNFFNDAIKDPFSSLDQVRATVERIAAQAGINLTAPSGYVTEGQTQWPAASEGMTPYVQAIMQGEILNWLTEASDQFLSVGNDKLSSVLEGAGRSDEVIYIKHYANQVNGRVGMSTTTINPQQNAWQRAMLVSPEGTIIYRPKQINKGPIEDQYVVEDFGSRGINPENRNFKAGIARNLFDWLESEPSIDVRAAMFDHLLLKQPIEMVTKRYPNSKSILNDYVKHKEYLESRAKADVYLKAAKAASIMARAKLNKDERAASTKELGAAYLRARKGQDQQGAPNQPLVDYSRRAFAGTKEAVAALGSLSSLTEQQIADYAAAFGKSKEAALVDSALIHLGDYRYGVDLGHNRAYMMSNLVVEQDGASNNYAYISGILGNEGLARATRLLAPARSWVENSEGDMVWVYKDVRSLAHEDTNQAFSELAMDKGGEALQSAYESFHTVLSNDASIRKNFWKSILMEFGYSRSVDSFHSDITEKFDDNADAFSEFWDNKDQLIELLSEGMRDALGSALGSTSDYADFVKAGGTVAAALEQPVLIQTPIGFPLLLNDFMNYFVGDSEQVRYRRVESVPGQPVVEDEYLLNINDSRPLINVSATKMKTNPNTNVVDEESARYVSASRGSVVAIHGADSSTLVQVFKHAAKRGLWGYGVYDAIVSDANSAALFADIYNKIQREDIKRWSTSPIETVEQALNAGKKKLVDSVKNGEPRMDIISNLVNNHIVLDGDFDGTPFGGEIVATSPIGKIIEKIREDYEEVMADTVPNRKDYIDDAYAKMGTKFLTYADSYPGGKAALTTDLLSSAFFSTGGHAVIPTKDEFGKKKVVKDRIFSYAEVGSNLKRLVNKSLEQSKKLHSQFGKDYAGGNLG